MAEIKKVLVISLESGLPVCCYSTEKSKNAGQVTDEELRLSSLLFTSRQLQLALVPFDRQWPTPPPTSSAECLEQGDQSLFLCVEQDFMVVVAGVLLPQDLGRSLASKLSRSVHQTVSVSKALGWKVLKQLLQDGILAVHDELCQNQQLGVPLFAIHRTPPSFSQPSPSEADSSKLSSPPSPMRIEASRTPSPSKTAQSGMSKYREEEVGEAQCCWWRSPSIAPTPAPSLPSVASPGSPADSSTPFLRSTPGSSLVLLGSAASASFALDGYASLPPESNLAADSLFLLSPIVRVYAFDSTGFLRLLADPGPNSASATAATAASDSALEQCSCCILVQDSLLTVVIRSMLPYRSSSDAMHWKWMSDVLRWTEVCIHSQAFPPHRWVAAEQKT